MKKLLFLLSTIAAMLLKLTGQTIPNAGFEEWYGLWGPEPVGWITNNTQIEEPVSWDTNAYEGDFAIKFHLEYSGRSGVAQSRFPFSLHPETITVYAKSQVDSIYANSISVYVYFGGHLVDSGKWTNTSSIPDWELQTIPVTQSTTQADTLEIIIRGGDWETTLTLDNFSYTPFVGIKEKGSKKEWSIYPIPAINQITVTNNGQITSGETYTICSQLGQVMQKGKLPAGLTLDISSLPFGVYFLSIGEEQNSAQKFIKR